MPLASRALTRGGEVGGQLVDVLVVRRLPPPQRLRPGPVGAQRYAALLDQLVRNAPPGDRRHLSRLAVDDAERSGVGSDRLQRRVEERFGDVTRRQGAGQAGREREEALGAAAGNELLLEAEAPVERHRALLEDRAGDGHGAGVERRRRPVDELHRAELARAGHEREAVDRLLARVEQAAL